ncbi:MAG: DUF1926 domain-containing protein [Candidatus Omnitrophica bacterium]|nr:DUF1926 domain-containing protein [Candidatus Omnitrophota bacterium]
MKKLLLQRDHFLSSNSDVRRFSQGRAKELKIAGIRRPLELSKTFIPTRKGESVSVSYRLTNRSRSMLAFLFGTEVALGLKDAHVNRVGEARGIRRFAVTDPLERLQAGFSLSRPARLWHFPLENSTESARGICRTYRGVSLTFLWPVRLGPRRSWSVAAQVQMESL